MNQRPRNKLENESLIQTPTKKKKSLCHGGRSINKILAGYSQREEEYVLD